MRVNTARPSRKMWLPKCLRKKKSVEEVLSDAQVASTKNQTLTHRVSILRRNEGRAENAIITARYTILSFAPLTLYELLHPRRRFANFYFLVVGVMQIIPQITITNGLPQTVCSISRHGRGRGVGGRGGVRKGSRVCVAWPDDALATACSGSH